MKDSYEQIISPVTIGIMIEAFLAEDLEKAQMYAEFIAQKYEKAGKPQSAKTIRIRMEGKKENGMSGAEGV